MGLGMSAFRGKADIRRPTNPHANSRLKRRLLREQISTDCYAVARFRCQPKKPSPASAEDVVHGLEEARKVIDHLFDVANTGKLIIKIYEEP